MPAERLTGTAKLQLPEASAVVVPTAVFAAPEDWSGGAADDALRRRVVRAAGELADQVDRRPPSTGPADPFALTADFEDLLGR